MEDANRLQHDSISVHEAAARRPLHVTPRCTTQRMVTLQTCSPSFDTVPKICKLDFFSCWWEYLCQEVGKTEGGFSDGG